MFSTHVVYSGFTPLGILLDPPTFSGVLRGPRASSHCSLSFSRILG